MVYKTYIKTKYVILRRTKGEVVPEKILSEVKTQKVGAGLIPRIGETLITEDFGMLKVESVIYDFFKNQTVTVETEECTLVFDEEAYEMWYPGEEQPHTLEVMLQKLAPYYKKGVYTIYNGAMFDY